MPTPPHGQPARRPTGAELAAAGDLTLPDLIGPDLRVLFVGINPSLYSAAVGRHFARPGNRFWPTLYAAEFTPRLLTAGEQGELLPLGLGITNVAARPTARAEELTATELRAGFAALEATVARWRPAYVAVLGVTAYRAATGARRAAVGPQEPPLAGAGVWVLPNPSGLNAHYQLPDLAAAYAELRVAAGIEPR